MRNPDERSTAAEGGCPWKHRAPDEQPSREISRVVHLALGVSAGSRLRRLSNARKLPAMLKDP